MQLSTSSETYIMNVYSTVSVISKRSAFSIIHFCHSHFHDPICCLCRRMQVSRSGFYKWRSKQARTDKHFQLIKRITEYQAISGFTTCYRKMAAYLRLKKLSSVSRSTIYRIMRKYGLLSQSLRTKKSQLIRREIKPFQNLLRRDFSADRPDQKWCIDITQIDACDKRIYLCAIIDLYDRSIVSYRVSDRQNRALVKNTIKIALSKVEPNSRAPIILHSDQGSIFRNTEHKLYLKGNNITPSMSNPGCPHDNAVIESFFSCLKSECIHLLPKMQAKEMISEIERYIVFYNYYRIHMRLGNTPMNIRNFGYSSGLCFTFGAQ